MLRKSRANWALALAMGRTLPIPDRQIQPLTMERPGLSQNKDRHFKALTIVRELARRLL
jgi:hypothetical protein